MTEREEVFCLNQEIFPSLAFPENNDQAGAPIA